ncbi:LPD38 domain-containing protein [Paenibacillus sp. S25]|uniref:LPD38 domain-containing protein n=1 Tax=Paenibacillus sp. S25 TaxID=2823905 RepID=UPI001C64FE50|nr:LPD38 domain-containing protein [Paenibacillus sp. S25]QYK61864.1 hypothetical protein KAI37_02188 [Paenibacillus sp. S25]
MASRYEQFVEQQRERAQQIKTDALNGTLQRQQPQQRMNRRTAAFNSNVTANPKLTDTSALSALPDALKIGPGFIEGSTFARAAAGNPKAKSTYKAATGLDIQPPQGPPNPTEYQLRMAEINETLRKHPSFEPIRPFSEGVTKLMSDTDTGNFTNRMFSTGGGMVIGDRPYYNVTTGNATADKVADYAGNIGGILAMGINPAAPGVKGQNLFTGPLEAAEGALATRAGQAVTGALSKQASRLPGVSAATANSYARGALSGAAAGAINSTAIGINQDQTTGREMLHNATLGAALGGGGDVILRGFGSGLREGLNRLKGREQVMPQADEMLALPLGRTDQRMAQAGQRSSLARGDDAIVNPTDWAPEPLGLPAGRNSTFVGESPLPTQRVGARPGASREPVQRVSESSINRQRTFSMNDPAVPEFMRARQARQQARIDDNVTVPESAPNQNIPISEAPPMKSNWFTNLFGNQGVGISAGTRNARRNLATTEGQIVDNPLRTDVEGIKAQGKSMLRTSYNNQVDLMRPLKHIDREAYEAAQDVRRANNLANTTVQDKFVDIEGNVLGQSLKEIGNKVARGQGPAFEDYLILRRAATRMARGENVYDPKLGMTLEKVNARKSMLEQRYPEFKGIASEWDDYYRKLRRLDPDLVNESQIAAMEKAEPYYASMRRQFSKAEKYSQPFAMKTRGFSGQKAPIKDLSPNGSVRKIVSPFRSAIEQTGSWYNASLRNRVMKSVYHRIEADPKSLKGIIEIVPENAEMRAKSLEEINSVLKTDGVEGLMEKLDAELVPMFRKSAQKGERTDNIVTVMINGNPVKMRVENPEVFKALVGMGPEESNFVLDLLGKLTNATKYGATGAGAPLFAAKSASVDVIQSLIQSKNPVRHLPDLFHAVISSIADTLPKGTPGVERIRALAQDFRRTGGEYSAVLLGDKALNRSVSGILREPFASPRGIGRGIRATASAPFKVLHKISDISENVNRIAAYKNGLRQNGNVRTPEAIRGAMRDSQEITVNFSRKGAKSPGLEKVFPYHNAAVQSIRKFTKQWKDNPVKTAFAVGSLIIGPKLYEYSQFSDDPDYQIIPTRDKYRNFIAHKNEDGTFVKIPMPPEYNAIGAVLVDMLTEIKDGNPVDWGKSADAIAGAYTPPFLSGALQGFTQGGGIKKSLWGTLNATSLAAPIAVASNQSFTGAPIEPQDLAANSPVNRYDERTSSVAIDISKKLDKINMGLSPKNVDYLLRAYGGDAARLLLPLTSEQGAGNARNTLLKNFIADPQFSNTLTSDFYDAKEKITQAYTDYQDGKADLPNWYSEELYKFVTSKSIGSITKRISELNGQKRELGKDKSLSAEQRADQQREIQMEINKIYIDINQRMEEAGVPL